MTRTISTGESLETASICDLDIVRQRRSQRLRDHYLLRHLPLAYSLARHYVVAFGTEEQLVAVASTGLVRAVQDFDAATGQPFASFAEPLIVAALEEYVQDAELAADSIGAQLERELEIEAAEQVIAEAIARQSHVRELAGFLDCDIDVLVGGLMSAVEREPHLVLSPAAREQPRPHALPRIEHG